MPSPSPDLDGRRTLAGQVVVFTGKLSSLGRKDAGALVARLGGVAAEDVSARTTMLVVGDEGYVASDSSRTTEEYVASDFSRTTEGYVASDFSRTTDEHERTDGPAEAGPHNKSSHAHNKSSHAHNKSSHAHSKSSYKSNKLKRAEELNLQQASRIQILSEADFCRLAGVPTPEALKRQYHAVRDLLARYRSVREDHLRYLVKYGVIRPVLRTNADTFFEFRDLAVIKQANDELNEGGSFRSIVRALMASRHGQLTFDFRLDAEPARVLELRRQVPRPAATPPEALTVPVRETELAESYFRKASLLDDGDESKQDEAAASYRKALELDPYMVAALINLANIHYSRDELAEAQALYERAIGLESDFFEAHFNLGNIYHDLGRFTEAQGCYRRALQLNPFYAEAHFYLAVTFEKMGFSQEARPHWRSYQQLAPNGEWVALAKEFSE